MKTSDIPMYILGGLIVTAFFITLYFLIFVPVPEVNQRVLDMTLGALIIAFGNVVGYYYGSSKGSADKTEMMKKNGDQPKP